LRSSDLDSSDKSVNKLQSYWVITIIVMENFRL
jgi:hypothetical protein